MRSRLLAGLAAACAAGAAGAAREGFEVIGRPAPPLAPVTWLRPSLGQPELRGRVVLVRWWTTGCSLCRNTAPALNRLHADFAARGLLVLGVFHPKPPAPRDPEEILAAARELGFRFPIGVDERWTALKRWWLDGGRRSFTSVSFLLDRKGTIRYVHPGGEYFPSERPEHAHENADYRDIRALVEKLLAEPRPPESV